MNRTDELIKFLEHDSKNNCIIEPENRHENLIKGLSDVISLYNPKIIVKAGLGNSELLIKLANEFDSIFVIVEPSLSNLKKFMDKYKNDKAFENIYLINGEFNSFPVDYYAANLLISLDNIDFLESNKVIDEFRRALDFGGIFFVGQVILNENDLEGVYDDYMRLLFPLHNDYYIEGDLKTFLDLNEFKFVKSNLENFKENLAAKQDHFKNLYGVSKDYKTFLANNENRFKELYDFDGEMIKIPYYTGVFMRKKPEVPND